MKQSSLWAFCEFMDVAPGSLIFSYGPAHQGRYSVSMQMTRWRQFGQIILLAGVIGIVGLILNPTSGASSYLALTTAYTSEAAVETSAASGSHRAGSPRIPYTEADLDLLARLVSSEAKGEPYLGQVAAAAVTINRVLDPRFPNTLAEVIYQIEGNR